MDLIAKAKAKAKPPPPPPKPSHMKNFSTPSSSAVSPQSSRKRGLGWPWDQPASQFRLYTSSTSGDTEICPVSWLFNWELWAPEGLPSDGSIEWVPTVRTAAQAKDIIPFLTDISTNRKIPIRHFLGFNEPEIPDQANLGVDEAVKLWRDVVLPAKEKFGFRLGSPGMSSDTSRSKPWLDAFLGQFEGGANGAGLDFLVVHWYGPRFEDMASFLGEMHATYNLPIWLNEFACSRMGGEQVSQPEVEQFLRQSIPFLEQTGWIERYAYFGNGQGREVGDWVGRCNNFTAPSNSCIDTDGRSLSNTGLLYLQL